MNKNQKGITLIVLVVTIGVILILAGTATGAIIGNNGIINQAKTSKQDQEIAAITSEINTIKNVWELDRKLNENLTEDDLWQRLVNADIMASVTDKTQTGERTYTVHTTQGYDISNITLAVLDTSQIITPSPTITDTTPPQEALISFSTTTSRVGETFTARIWHIENESGIQMTSCKWVFNTTSTAIGTNSSAYTGGTFSTNPQTISLTAESVGAYYLHVLTTDTAGNTKETISEELYLKSPIFTLDKTYLQTGSTHGNVQLTENNLDGTARNIYNWK